MKPIVCVAIPPWLWDDPRLPYDQPAKRGQPDPPNAASGHLLKASRILWNELGTAHGAGAVHQLSAVNICNLRGSIRNLRFCSRNIAGQNRHLSSHAASSKSCPDLAQAECPAAPVQGSWDKNRFGSLATSPLPQYIPLGTVAPPYSSAPCRCPRAYNIPSWYIDQSPPHNKWLAGQ